jgi:hypothetical protein
MYGMWRAFVSWMLYDSRELDAHAMPYNALHKWNHQSWRATENRSRKVKLHST